MGTGNETQISEFFLLGFTEDPELQHLLWAVPVQLTGHLHWESAHHPGIISDSHLHTPMYFFLSNLSLCDICLSSTTVPKMLVNIQTQNKVITYAGCITQMYFFMIFVGLEDFLLDVMYSDHFLAICHPLNYTVIMNSWLCILLVLGSWTMSVMQSFLEGLIVLWLSFCSHIEIPHFFCELHQIVQLDCSDTFFNCLVVYFIAAVFAWGPLVGILFSYYKIVSSVCVVSSAQGRYKAFSTCLSHISVVSLFYCTSIGVYLSPTASHSTHSSTSALVMYTVATPMLNPFIYNMRNKDIKQALKKCFGRKACKVSVVL